MFSLKVLPQSFLILTLAITAITGCDQNKINPVQKLEPLPEEAHVAINAQNEFAFKLFDLVNQEDQSNDNKLISPLSIYMDLSMVYNGADKQTKEGMQDALQMNDIDTALLNKTNAVLLNNLPKSDPKVNLDIANAIWYRQTLNPLSSFLGINKKYYKAQVVGADFDDQQTVTDINNWVKDKTQNKITSIIKEIHPADVMFLLNAVYFKGEWTKKFDPKLTENRAFHTAGAGQKQTPFMYTEDYFNYLKNDSLQIIELPYGSDKFSMVILLPSVEHKVHPLIASLNSEKFSKFTTALQPTKIELYLPKWESAYKIDNLQPELTQMGMGDAFSTDANFSKMYSNQGVKISQVKHKTYIKVDEKGTEAAAVTSTGMMTTSAPAGGPSVMNVNRPFFYAIIAKNSGSILFLGKVNDPTAKE